MKPTPRTLKVSASRACLATLTLALASSLAGAPAAAGIRDMVKSAKDKAVQKTGGKSAETPARPEAVPIFDDRVLELTDARLDRLLAGFKAAAAFTADLPKLVARQEALNDELQKLNNTHEKAFNEYVEKRNAHKSCMREELNEIRSNRHKDMVRQSMANPAQMQKLAQLSMRFSEAQTKGDTAAVRTLTAEMEAMQEFTPEDSLAARKKCGAPTPPPPAFVRMETAHSELGGVDEKIRDMNLKVRQVQLDTSELTEAQMGIAMDRIYGFLAAAKEKKDPQGFSPTELKALAAHKDALAAALGT